MASSKKAKIKDEILGFLPSGLLVFGVCFMLMIYEPLFTYFTNINDFWFDFSVIIKSLLITFAKVFLLSLAIIAVVYTISNKWEKGKKIYNYVLLAFFGMFFVTYIQGNFLVNNLPHLDGEEIIWANYILDDIISIGLFAIVLISIFVLAKKRGSEKIIKGAMYTTLVILALLGTSLISSAIAEDGLRDKGGYYVTDRNLHNASTDENLMILVLDSIDAETFEQVVMENPDYKEVFRDFTFYPDTVSAYGFTRDTMPFIMSGVWNENEMKFQDYYAYAMDNSKMIEKLTKEKYNINIYDYELLWQNTDTVENLEKGRELLDRPCFTEQEAKYVAFKYLPFYLKQFSGIESMDFAQCRGVPTGIDGELYGWGDVDVYRKYISNPIVKQEEKYFSLVHVEGAHGPFWVTEDLTIDENGTSYEQMLKASIKLTDAYLERLKENDVYDNSAIIIMADHGVYGSGRQNPMFLIKGRNEKHSEMKISETPVSYEDIVDIYGELIDGKKAEQAVESYVRERRRFIYNEFNNEDHMVEYEQTGKAWDKLTLIPTGREFNR